MWGNIYETSLKSLAILQNKAIIIITFSKRDEHSNPLYAKLKLLKIKDLVHFHNTLCFIIITTSYQMHTQTSSKVSLLFVSTEQGLILKRVITLHPLEQIMANSV